MDEQLVDFKHVCHNRILFMLHFGRGFLTSGVPGTCTRKLVVGHGLSHDQGFFSTKSARRRTHDSDCGHLVLLLLPEDQTL